MIKRIQMLLFVGLARCSDEIKDSIMYKRFCVV